MSKYPRIIEALAIMALVVPSVMCTEEFNGTTYRLELSQMDVTVPVNASRLNLTLHQQASNITLLDEGGRMVGINSSYSFWRGDHIYNIAFEKHVSGELAYSMPHQGQQFILSLRDGGPVRVILPPGHATGNHILGIARPDPDEISVDKGRMVITWQNASRYQIIEVSYYQEKAPEALMKIFAVLVVAGVLLLIEYYASIRKLRAIREDAERKGKIQQ
jgi:Family of unknown function (DUF5803)